jgi:hypothetical protein
MPTREKIEAIRAERECGLLEAKRVAENHDLHDSIDNATTIEDVKGILRRIVGDRL